MQTVLDGKTLLICRKLAAGSLARDYYLAGGTALALQVGHRRSLDLDFFQLGSEEKISFPKTAAELSTLYGKENLRLQVREVDQVVWRINELRITFLAYPFPLLYPLNEGVDFSPQLSGLFLAGPREIATMKAYALGRRATFRDYIDLYYLLRNQMVTLEGIIEDAGKKFILRGEKLFSTKLFLEQLSYTGDVEDKEAVLELLFSPRPTVAEVQDYLANQALLYIKNKIDGREEEKL